MWLEKTLSKGDSKACCILLLSHVLWERHTEDEGGWVTCPRRLANQGWDPAEWLCLWGPSQSLKEEGGSMGRSHCRGLRTNLLPEDLREKVTAGELSEKVDFYIVLKGDRHQTGVSTLDAGWGRPCAWGRVPVHHQSLTPGFHLPGGPPASRGWPPGTRQGSGHRCQVPIKHGSDQRLWYHPVLPEPSTCLLFPCSPSHFD